MEDEIIATIRGGEQHKTNCSTLCASCYMYIHVHVPYTSLNTCCIVYYTQCFYTAELRQAKSASQDSSASEMFQSAQTSPQHAVVPQPKRARIIQDPED